MLRENQAEY